MTVDLRLPEHRREVFTRFYLFHLRHRSHPGCVYYLFPYLRERFGWDDEEALWFAFINGNTQHPVTSLLLHQVAPTPAHAPAMLDWFRANYQRLAFDTDRRHHKKSFPEAVASYIAQTGPSQARYWHDQAAGGFAGIWAAATGIYSFGRLSAFSYGEYLRIMGVPFDCDTLFLGDRSGSRSHRNGMCIVTGRDQYDWHASNPGFDGNYPPDLIAQLEDDAAELLAEAARRSAGQAHAADVSYFTLESALCTYKSWHRPNRRYPNVYNDMLHDRLRLSEKQWPGVDLSVFWNARRANLPSYLLLESMPGDPGCVAVKQNHYRTTGQTVVMGREDPMFASDFDANVDRLAYGTFR
jgi:hypothetical protein